MAAKPAHAKARRNAARPRRHRLFLPGAAAVIIAVVTALAIATPSAGAGSIFQPYEGNWHATSQGVYVMFTDSQANMVWVTPKGACPLSAKVKFSAPAKGVMRGAVRAVSKCVAKAHILRIGQRVVVLGNPAAHHLRLIPPGLQTLWLCRSAKDPACKDRG